jgi:transcriptional regulator with XRE-family HTH domain
MSALAKLIGPKLKQKRLEFGFTIEFMAEILDCSRQLIEHYEKGYCEMPLDRLSEFSKLCDLPIDWFFLEENSMLVRVVPLNKTRKSRLPHTD